MTHAAYSTALPFVSNGGFTAFTMRSPRNPDVEMDVQATQRIVSPDYFAAMRLRLVAGRTLSDADTPTTPPAVVVNRSFARQYLGDHPVGVHIPQHGTRAGAAFRQRRMPIGKWSAWSTTCGRTASTRRCSPRVFASFKQIAPAAWATSIRFSSSGPPPIRRRTCPRCAACVHEQAPALALDSVMTMEDRVMTSLAKPRLYAVVLVGFGAFALLIAGVGLFGVLSFSVAQRTREIGVRSALGAQARDIVALVLRQALWIVAGGVVIGLAAALAGVRLLSAFLYGISPTTR